MFLKNTSLIAWFGRIALFTVYFWFGILKTLDLSPANPLIRELLTNTIPFWSFGSFITFFGYIEMLIGISFLWPRLIKISSILTFIHLITTVLPLILLPSIAWQASFIPTIEGQYIIKNLLIVSTILFLLGDRERAKRLPI